MLFAMQNSTNKIEKMAAAYPFYKF